MRSRKRWSSISGRPPEVLLADQVLGRHLDVLEPDFVDLVFAVQHDDRTHLDARRLHVDQQEGNAFLLASFGRGANQAENPVGVLAERSPGLLAVDHVMVAVGTFYQLGAHFQRGQVGARTGLGIALAPPVAAVDDARQETLLLRRIAEGHDYRRHHLEAEGQLHRRAGIGAFLVKNVLLYGVPAGAAEGRRPARRAPAPGVEQLLPTHEIILRQTPATEHFAADFRGQFGAQETAHFLPERLLFGSEIEIHRYSVLCCVPGRD